VQCSLTSVRADARKREWFACNGVGLQRVSRAPLNKALAVMNTLYDVLAFVGGSGILLAAAAWLIRSALSHASARDLEAFKSRLQSTSTTEIERLRHELKLIATDLEKRSVLLNEKRADVISELYRRLVDFVSSAESFAAIIEWGGASTKEEKAVILGQAASEFVTYYQYHRIYFSDELCATLKTLFDTVHGPSLHLRMWMNLKDRGGSAPQKYDEAWTKAWETIQKDVPPILAAVEAEFRSLLGVPK